jgi:hypothetical protein
MARLTLNSFDFVEKPALGKYPIILDGGKRNIRELAGLLV